MSANTTESTRFRVADLKQNRPTGFALRPDAKTLQTLARELGLLGLRKVSFVGELRAAGKTDWELVAHLGATVQQACVVSLEPVTTRIETDAERRFLSVMPDLGEDEEVEMPDDENAELLGAEIDIFAVLSEALALNLPLYPRADDAELAQTAFTEPGKQAMSDDDARPFAGLAALRDKLEGDVDK